LVSYFGFVNARKGVDTLLQALGILAMDAAAPVRPRLVMIGGQTGASDPTNVAFLAQIQALISRLGLEDAVRWTGYLSPQEVTASFMAADVCTLPFRDGVSFLHGTFHAALAHGVPIVTTRPRASLPELVDGDNVRLVPAGDPAALKEALVELAGAPEMRRRLGEGARALSQQFLWPKIAADTLALYRRIGAG
jgi:glycosyltransferase involved in cell wall biosynthesis